MERFREIIKQMSPEDEESQLQMHGMKDELVESLLRRGNYSKAAQRLSADGKDLEAAGILCDMNPTPTMPTLRVAPP